MKIAKQIRLICNLKPDPKTSDAQFAPNAAQQFVADIKKNDKKKSAKRIKALKDSGLDGRLEVVEVAKSHSRPQSKPMKIFRLKGLKFFKVNQMQQPDAQQTGSMKDKITELETCVGKLIDRMTDNADLSQEQQIRINHCFRKLRLCLTKCDYKSGAELEEAYFRQRNLFRKYHTRREIKAMKKINHFLSELDDLILKSKRGSKY